MKRIILVVLTIVVFSIGFEYFWHRSTPDNVLAKNIHTLLEQGQTNVDLQTLTEYDWTKAVVFGPYTSREQISEVLGVEFKGDDGGIEMLDDRFLLVFANETQALKTVVLSRANGDFEVHDHRYLIMNKQ